MNQNRAGFSMLKQPRRKTLHLPQNLAPNVLQNRLCRQNKPFDDRDVEQRQKRPDAQHAIDTR